MVSLSIVVILMMCVINNNDVVVYCYYLPICENVELFLKIIFV